MVDAGGFRSRFSWVARLGLDADENGGWRQESGLTVFATFASETE